MNNTVLCWCSARRGRIYLPQDELAQAGISEEDIFAGKVTDKWRNFMKKQIKRARKFFDDAEIGVKELSPASRWPVSILSSTLFKTTKKERRARLSWLVLVHVCECLW